MRVYCGDTAVDCTDTTMTFRTLTSLTSKEQTGEIKYLSVLIYPIAIILMLYSQRKGVKQKYMLYISGSVASRQYIHKCCSLWNPNWLLAVSQSPPPLSFRTLSPQWLSSAESSLPHNDSQTLESISSLRLLVGGSSLSLSSLDSRSSKSSGSLG